MVLPGLLDSAPRRRIAARQRARPPDRVHRTIACGPAPPRARILPAKGSTGAHDLVKVPTAAYFREHPDDVAPDELASYCLHALAAASSLPSKAAVRRLVTVTVAGLRPPR